MYEDDWNGGDLTGSLLVAMPSMTDERFERTVIFVCAHSEDGAMGLVVNKLMDDLTLPALLRQLKIEPGAAEDAPIHYGGPVESSRGFVLHTADYVQESTMVITDNVALTATIEVLRAIARGEGPTRKVMALGYAGWTAGQLDSEIQANGWLSVPADEEILFGTDHAHKWERALAKLGVTPGLLSGEAGHA
ncbi:MAG: YqgE/AlgH family protein [Alphaproteobacteria bacterium]|jgi:putative transcriptional regulator|nr:YqgE/AlgH family protein [Alphaproteobacteria bacterium]